MTFTTGNSKKYNVGAENLHVAITTLSGPMRINNRIINFEHFKEQWISRGKSILIFCLLIAICY